MFDRHLARWDLVPDGDPIVTRAAHLLPVLRSGEPAMLKLSVEEDERLGGDVMEWWDGDGAARVLARHDNALLLERATGRASLADMARTGQDDKACRILCATAARLHAPRTKPRPELTPLAHWFRALEPAARTHGGIFVRCAASARALLEEPREVVVLHGDLHHDNVLDFGPRGWLAIDPKHLVGERSFDFVNIFTNPDLTDPTRPVATTSGGFARRLEIVTEAACLERDRLLRWILNCPQRGSWRPRPVGCDRPAHRGTRRRRARPMISSQHRVAVERRNGRAAAQFLIIAPVIKCLFCCRCLDGKLASGSAPRVLSSTGPTQTSWT